MFDCATFVFVSLFVFVSYGSYNVFAENDILQHPIISSYDRLKELGEMCLVDILPILENIAEQQKERNTANSRIFDETQGILDRIEGHQEVNDKQLKELKVKMEGHFMDLHAMMDLKVKKLSLEKSLRKALNALQCSLDTRNVSSKVSLHPGFVKVGGFEVLLHREAR
ncbi:GM19434 [Drosophila sechellia]|uniref:GM19434 n=1 Tax=Drosophila sechellia TaxID=7238 RepID=B4ID00_DROSE|nr:GM19434 [Drosophila sechellia]